PDVVALFAAARGELPVAAPAPAGLKLDHGRVTLVLGTPWGATAAHIKSIEFYPYAEGSIDYAAPQILTHTATGVELAVKAGDQPPGQELRGVLVAAEQNGADTATVAMEIVASATAVAKPRAGDLPETPAFATLILLAVAGGLILNLMPCVLPVLSIKAIGLVEQAKKHPAAVRTKGLVFAAGVISSMLVMAVVLLALRAGGEQIGWGFQLQSPLFVTLMIYLLLGVGLNLSGVFEVGGGFAGLGDDLTRDDSHRASFFTGVLTTLVATPCTAPFMAAAVGAALTQSRTAALSIFASLGIGLSLPFVLLSLAPWTRRILPKPGAWMQTLKQAFAFPMYASAAWLLWVLAQQTSSVGLAAALAGAVLVALAGWAYQKSHAGGGAGGRLAAVTTAIVALGLAVFLPWHFAGAAAPAALGASPVAAEQDWQPWDAAHIASLNAAGHPVLVNFTASWCLTCLVNERSAFADSAVRQVFREKNVVLMKGDWTNRNPAITEALAAFGRAGVPLYLVYRAGSGGSEPLVLPQLLTAAIVHDAFADSQTAESR
ncbi:MAG: thioredoxin family protein, partial [Pseudomonadota bacterium]|nr:thioredoxin family protein [Pseudomonadota bacterium]